MANTWNESGTTWGTNRWGTTDAISSGWGADAWGTGGSWGQATDEVVQITGLGLSSAVGSIEAFNEIGWGHDAWGEEGWGRANDSHVSLDGFGLQSTLGNSTWGAKTYGNNAWGTFTFDIDQLSLGITSPGTLTSSVGSPTMIGNVSVSPTGQSATASQGSLDPKDQVMGPTGQSATASQGSLTPADVMGVSGLSSSLSLGDVSTNSNPIIDITGIAITSSIGTIDPADQSMGLTGISATFSVGALDPKDQTMGLTGQSVTASVAAFGTASGFGIQAYSDVDTGSNSSYTDVATGSNTSYTDAA
jgi:hypothetical protein